MAGKGKAVGALIRYGPFVAEAARRYGPTVWEQVKGQREPAEKFVQARVAKGNQRKKALTHAATVVDGTVLQVFHRSDSHWVVFSGKSPIGVHPPTSAGYEELLRNADLSNRLRPQDAHRTIQVPRRRTSRPPPPQAPAPPGGTAPESAGGAAAGPPQGDPAGPVAVRKGQRPTA